MSPYYYNQRYVLRLIPRLLGFLQNYYLSSQKFLRSKSRVGCILINMFEFSNKIMYCRLRYKTVKRFSRYRSSLCIEFNMNLSYLGCKMKY